MYKLKMHCVTNSTLINTGLLKVNRFEQFVLGKTYKVRREDFMSGSRRISSRFRAAVK